MAAEGLTAHVAAHIVSAADTPVDHEIAEKAKQHVLDGFVAMLSGASLPAGEVALRYARRQCGDGPATVLGSDSPSSTEVAALANGTSAHADETDDCNELARLHPGASILPAALALGEATGQSGERLLRAVTAGYDVGCSMSRAAWGSIELRQKAVQRPSGVGQTYGAATAAAIMAGLDHLQVRHVLSYTAQLASGLTSYLRDDSHIEKAFALGGMQARVGVLAVELVRSGFTGVDDILDTYPTIFDVFGKEGNPELLRDELGTVSHIMTTDLKRYATGGPIQAAAQALEEILAEEHPAAEDVSEIVCHLPSGKGSVVKDRKIPDIDTAHLLALGLVDGGIRFKNAHDYTRVSDPAVAELRQRVSVILDKDLDPEEGLEGSSRRAKVEIILKDGRRLTRTVDRFRGSRQNRMGWDELEGKAHDVLQDWGSAERVDKLIAQVRSLDGGTTVTSLMAAAKSG